MTRAFSRSLSALVFASALAACGGTSTGNPSDGDPDGGKGENTGLGGAYANCKATPSDLASLDTDSPLGFSASDMLALAQAQSSVTLEWAQKDNLFGYQPASATTELTLELQAKAKPARFVQLEPKPDGSGQESGGGLLAPASGDGCPDHVELDVHVLLKTADGAFDEAFDTTLHAERARSATFRSTVKAEDIHGTFELADTKLGNIVFHLASLQIQGTFSQLGASGSIMPTLVSDGESGGSSTSAGAGGIATGGGGLAHWPAGNAACQDEALLGQSGVPRALDDAFGQASLQDTIDRVNAAAALSLAWQHDAATKLDVSFSTTQSEGCAHYATDDSGAESDGIVWLVRGKLHATSADERIDGDWPVAFEAYFDDAGKLERVAVTSDPHGSIVVGLVAAPQFASTFGIAGIDVGSYDEANALVSLEWDFSTAAGASTTGTLTVQGANVPDCQQEPLPEPPAGDGSGATPGGSAGCMGIQLEKLEAATISGP